MGGRGPRCRRRIEVLLLPKVNAGQQACSHFLTVRQLRVRLADIGHTGQKSEALNLGAMQRPRR